jgi:hypothetical protein
MHRSWTSLLAFLFALPSAGCHRVSYTPEFLRTDGFRYRAGSAVVGAALDTLRVAVVVVNESRQPRFILISSFCAPFNRIGVTVRAHGRKWDSDVWRPPPPQPASRDAFGNLILKGCSVVALGLAPGASRTFVLAVAVREILGDSLPNGRYQVAARVQINAQLVRGLELGDVELSSAQIVKRRLSGDAAKSVSGQAHPGIIAEPTRRFSTLHFPLRRTRRKLSS